MKCKLGALCSYVKEKVKTETLDKKNYISTENMLPNKGGITLASSLPSTEYTSKYQAGDILISNIRPYFKKIWKAEYDGGCSNDVLVLRANDDCYIDFLYYALASDFFFDYATATAKGTKMPRGDKTAIMDFEVPYFDFKIQVHIAGILKSLDEKIALNNKINENLGQQAQALYHEWFECVDRNSLPSGWKITTLDEIAEISKRVFNPAKEQETMLEHYSIPAYDERKFPVFEISSQIKSNKYIVDNSCLLISKLNPTIKRVWKPYCLTNNAVCSTEFIVYRAKDKELTDFLYSVIDSATFSDFMCSHVTGSTGSRQRTTPTDTLAFEFVLPKISDIQNFQHIVSPMYKQMKNNAVESQKLMQLRDSLLPKLMSGEIEV